MTPESTPARLVARLAVAVVCATAASDPAVAHADEPALHRVTYTVTADQPTAADIYYRDTDPHDWAEYSHNPYQLSPRAEADLGPGRSWTHDAMLARPDQWAMVSATSGYTPATPHFRCRLMVDGAVVAVADGPKGALCSLRNW